MISRERIAELRNEWNKAGKIFICGVPSLGVECKTLKDLLDTLSAALDCVEMLSRTRGQWIHSVNAQDCLKVLAPFREEAK
jgi:hypothetical protein